MVNFFNICLFLAVAVGARAETCAEVYARSKTLLEAPLPPVGLELPNCDKKGGYAPKQCRGSQCFCVMSDGTETGHSVYRWEAPQDMHCNCAIMSARLAKYGILRLAECAADGSYKAVQCRGKHCFCVDAKTGLAKGRVTKYESRGKLRC